MSFTIYNNPASASFAGRGILSLIRVIWSTERPEILDSGDDDEFCAVARHGRAVVRGRMYLLDSAEAASLSDLRGRLELTISDVAGAADRTVRIDDVSLSGCRQEVADQDLPANVFDFLSPSLPEILNVP
ncbi:MAG: hypothetical protein ACLFUJ_02990 [Phycisphaerae bacterium]